ncbi:TIM-barrel domain-containing protein [Gracilimonas mengyeensis]|uniref:Alpha-glucosidase, glycosyl hydrolase family GH31 n=1 Tax=Gracilimonas mengyeensis TaxID=1302730 RepID=A0A521BFM2_9BACT|nr:TIM-barrel domain-containing protein [Gracilimonas mengyeensis]SMO45873.1 Alpha-glucosidase, glycosyl hydrolase family GH31 [Gracilimonas mengyeensis]
MKITPRTFRPLLTLILFIIGMITIHAQPVLEQGNFQVFVDESEGIRLAYNNETFAHVEGFQFNFVPTEITGIEQGNGENQLIINLALQDSDGYHENFPEEIELTLSHTGQTFHFEAGHETFNHITIKMRELDEHYFGLIEKLYPGNRKSPDLRGETIDVDVHHKGEENYAENYASAYSAFFMSSNGYGSFFDTFARGQYQFAKDGATEIYHQTDSLDWYLFYGPTGDVIHREYFGVIGEPKSVPIWAVGPVVWRDDNGGDSTRAGGSQEILKDLEKFTDMKIPLTATFVDRPYSNGTHEWSKMDFNEKFANPEEWIGIINDKYGMEFMSWVGSLTFGDPYFPGLLPGDVGYIDLTHPEALAEFERRMEWQYRVGVKGHKMDRADENFPMTAVWYDEVPQSETRNKYVYLYAKVIDKFLEKSHGDDQFNFARAAYHRSQPYLSAIWGGDVRPNWQGMSGNMANAMRAGFMGFPVWGNDTGGYLGDGFIDEQLYIRWLQWSVWNGMFEIKIDGMGGSGKDRAPWQYSQQLQDVFRDVTELRMAMLPYAYSLANTSDQNGVLMKPMTYMYPDDETTYEMWNQYIFGDAFLVAPLFSPNNSREVYLPEGTWYDYHDLSTKMEGRQTITKKVSLQEIPIFVKANSIYLTGDIYRGNSKNWRGNLEGNESLTIHLFPGEPGQTTSFTYVDYLDDDQEKVMKLSRSDLSIQFNSEALAADSHAIVRLDSEPQNITVNGEPVEFQYNDDQKTVSVEINAGSDIEVIVKQ